MPVISQAERKAANLEGKHDALALLTADHKEVAQLFKSYEALVSADAEDDEKEALADQICAMLIVHATIEEEIFYPAARENLDMEDLLDEAQVEHATARDLISQIQDMESNEDLFDAKVKVLGEYIEHHVREEEDELFPKVRRTKLDLQAVGHELAARKQQLLSRASTKVT